MMNQFSDTRNIDLKTGDVGACTKDCDWDDFEVVYFMIVGIQNVLNLLSFLLQLFAIDQFVLKMFVIEPAGRRIYAQFN